MFALLFTTDNIAHVGALLYLAGFLLRDQILLRAFVMGGDFVYIMYFYFAPAMPLWGGVFWSVVLVLVNASMIIKLLAERRDFAMNEEERRLFSLLDGLTPGEFRRLVKAGEWCSAGPATVVTRENENVDHLYYVLDGTIGLAKAGQAFSIRPETFIGEIAFLLKRPASATVTLPEGARYISWEIGALRRLMLRAPSLAVALAAALNRDMAEKVARAA
jgi:CRP-like cAMP-binding protein